MLDVERQFYEDHLSEWLKTYEHRFVLVHGHDLLGVYNTQDEALRAGAREFGLGPFLVRQVEAEQPEVLVPALSLGLLRADPELPVTPNV